MEAQGRLIKIIAKNHQYLGVENVLKALRDIKTREGRLGVFCIRREAVRVFR